MQDGRGGTDSWGIDLGYRATNGDWHETPDATRDAIRAAMGGGSDEPRAPQGPPVWTVPAGWGGDLQDPCRLELEDGTEFGLIESLPADLPIGRHRLTPVDGGPTTLLLVRPRACHRPPGMRRSALAVQAYASRSRESWGIGDLRDLRVLGGWARQHGIDHLALSPLHAPSPGDHPQPSPYYPSSRRNLNPLHIAVEEIPGAAHDPQVGALGDDARALLADRRIDRTAVWAAKRQALELLFDRLGTEGRRELEQFRAERGDDLERWAVFCTISEQHPGSWGDWPTDLQHPDNPQVARFAAAHAERVRFHCWLQLVADRQLATLAAVAPVVTDLAVGVDPGGADAWIDQDLLALDARVGAPPDDFAADGQDWGLPPSIPHLMCADGYETFARTIRAALRHGAGIRIDHVLGLFRLFWIPPGGSARDGAYVRYPADDLLSVLAIESERAGAFVIGEDLGTVEEGVRDDLAQIGVLGTRLVYFEDSPPSQWPSNVGGAVTTHDLPTIAGTWTGTDARLRDEAGLATDGTDGLRESLVRLVGDGDRDIAEVVVRCHRALAESPVELAIANLDDVLGVAERPNMPGTTDEWPNWSIAHPDPIDDLVEGPTPPPLDAIRRPDR